MGEKEKFLSSKIFFRTIIFLVLINAIFLDFIVFENKKTEITENIIPQPIVSNFCPVSCISEINNATRSAALFVQSSPTPTLKTEFKVSAQAQSFVKEFFVPFGTGSNSSDDWQDISGLKATINLANYPNIKIVTFESTIRIPNGNEVAYARLYNITDKHPVWFSDVSLEGGLPQLLISKPITLDAGNKTYQVQMKTSLKSPAFLDQSRIHIIVN